MPSPDKIVPPIVIAAPGRLGDIVTAESIFRKAHEQAPERPVIFVTRREFAEVMSCCPYISEIRTLSDKAAFKTLEKDFPPGSSFIRINLGGGRAVDQPSDPMALSPSLLQKFEAENDLPPTDDAARFYLDPQAKPPAGLPDKYIVFHCSSNGRSRQWSPVFWRRLARYCLSRHMGVVEIGFGSVLQLNEPGFVSICGQCDLQATAATIAGAEAIVGIESGMLHIANALDVFGFVISGKLRDLPEYNLYCGNYRIGIKCNILRFYDRLPIDLPYEPVEETLRRFLDGKPMSATECDLYFLKYQLARMQHNPFIRFFRMLNRPFERIKLTLLFSRRPRRPAGKK